MEPPRSFRNLAPRTKGTSKPPTPTTATTSATSTAVPAPAKPTTAPASAMPTTATELVAALPAPLPSDYDAKWAVKGKGYESDNRKRSSDKDDVIDVDRESKRAWARSAYLLVVCPGVSFRFLALVNKVRYKLEAEVEDLKKQVEDEKRRTENWCTAADGLRVERDAAWASIDRKNLELTHKAKEIVSLKAEARKSAATLLAEAEKSAIALAAAEERELYSAAVHAPTAAIMKKRDGELSKIVDRLRRADEQILSLERKFARAKGKFDELQGDPRSNMVYQVLRVANLDFVRFLMGLLDGHEPPKIEDELTFLTADVTEHAGDEERFEELLKSLHGLLHVLDPKIEDVADDAETIGAAEEMRMGEDSQGPRIDALTEDPRLDDVFGEREVEGAPVAQVAPPGVDEETVS
ncbi:hypothetical protein AALP_AA5G165400 [Arabis alpina]|uniref:Uncharacterized protein n=1 Tax=Arabis alpina TaxID=50452 RepID=A0A087GXI6_ARAAL|nr:hypothetical protein AALP_AA5G165400 [Arabis alpina]